MHLVDHELQVEPGERKSTVHYPPPFMVPMNLRCRAIVQPGFESNRRRNVRLVVIEFVSHSSSPCVAAIPSMVVSTM